MRTILLFIALLAASAFGQDKIQIEFSQWFKSAIGYNKLSVTKKAEMTRRFPDKSSGQKFVATISEF